MEAALEYLFSVEGEGFGNEEEEEEASGGGRSYKMVFVVNTALNMGVGKIAAQVMSFLLIVNPNFIARLFLGRSCLSGAIPAHFKKSRVQEDVRYVGVPGVDKNLHLSSCFCSSSFSEKRR